MKYLENNQMLNTNIFKTGYIYLTRKIMKRIYPETSQFYYMYA